MASEDQSDPGSGGGVGGWMMRSHDPASIIDDLKTYGQIFRLPVPDGPRTRSFSAGQPCFLLVEEPGNEAFKPAIWAVGEVVAELTERTDGSLMAEVEMMPLQERIRRADLIQHEVLGRSELSAPPGDDQPLRLSRPEVRALEEWDFDLRPPTPEQEAALALALADVDAELHELYGE